MASWDLSTGTIYCDTTETVIMQTLDEDGNQGLSGKLVCWE